MIVDRKYVKWISKAIWLFGLFAFLKIGFGNYWDTIKFVYQFIASLLSEQTISPQVADSASLVFREFINILLTCILFHVALAIVAFTMTGSQYIVDQYLEKDEVLLKALSKKVKFQEQHLKIQENYEALLKTSKNQIKAQTKAYQHTHAILEAVADLSSRVEVLSKSIKSWRLNLCRLYKMMAIFNVVCC